MDAESPSCQRLSWRAHGPEGRKAFWSLKGLGIKNVLGKHRREEGRPWMARPSPLVQHVMCRGEEQGGGEMAHCISSLLEAS